MFGRRTTFILLNQTNEELALDRQSQSFLRCSCPSGLKPPDSILSGEYGVWMLEPSTQVSRMKGSLQYSICGGSPSEQIRICWDKPLCRADIYKGIWSGGYEMKILGGEGTSAVVVFVFSTCNSD